MSQFEFDSNDEFDSGGMSFDFKGFVFKLLSYWWLFLISLAIAFTVAYMVNDRKQNIYSLESLISISSKTSSLVGLARPRNNLILYIKFLENNTTPATAAITA